MSKPKRQCVYIKKANLLYKIFWVNVAKKDDSIMIGMDSTTENILKVYDPLCGEMEADRDFKHQAVNRTSHKITFHASGKIKIGSSLIGKIDSSSLDRCTIEGIPPNEIEVPKRMLEVLIPKYLSKYIIKIEDFDGSEGIVIDTTYFPENHPLRCTVSCMSKINFEEIIKNKKKFVDTSLYEGFHGLEFKNSVWAFTIRISKEDTEYPDKFIIFVPGKIKWPPYRQKNFPESKK